MKTVLRYVGQAVLYLPFAVAVGYLSDSPAYTYFDPDKALIKLSISQVGERKGECRVPESVAGPGTRAGAGGGEKSDSYRRARMVCPRERVPVLVEVRMDGRVIYRGTEPPTGLSDDGPSMFYERLPVAPGRHVIEVGMRTSREGEGFDYTGGTETTLSPRQVFVIDFRTESRQFIFK